MAKTNTVDLEEKKLTKITFRTTLKFANDIERIHQRTKIPKTTLMELGGRNIVRDFDNNLPWPINFEVTSKTEGFNWVKNGFLIFQRDAPAEIQAIGRQYLDKLFEWLRTNEIIVKEPK